MTDEATTTEAEARPRDEGAILVLALVIIIVSSLMVIPLLGYATTVARSSRVGTEKAGRAEAVKGGLRTALSDPINLYKACNNNTAGLTVAVNLASPGMNTPVSTKCYWMASNYAQDPATLPWGFASVKVGATVPAGVVGPVYTGSGQAPETAWLNDATTVQTPNKVWAPRLPTHGLNKRSVAGYSMPSGFTPCTVYFPGTYQDDLVITGSTPVYFTSGIYYFEKSVRMSGDANVVVGGGANAGCTSDQEAAFYATNAPTAHNINGLGATFVFGAAGRLVIDTVTAPLLSTGASILFNQRYVAAGDTGAAPSAGVSIMSVNGALAADGVTASDLSIPGVINVPLSQVGNTTPTTALSQSYVPSTLTPAMTPTQTPIIDINLTTLAKVTVSIPGYVAVPQGVVSVSTALLMTGNKSLSISGGVLASSIALTGPTPATFSLGLVNPIAQQTLKLVTTTTSGNPVVTSTAIVQVNQNGAYAINSWAVQ